MIRSPEGSPAARYQVVQFFGPPNGSAKATLFYSHDVAWRFYCERVDEDNVQGVRAVLFETLPDHREICRAHIARPKPKIVVEEVCLDDDALELLDTMSRSIPR